jgi:NAD(P)-dependent dehydrogenase (short-subunit alcohol dehydrogenase family)
MIGSAGLAALINNAGDVVSGPLLHLPMPDFRRQLEASVVGVLSVTKAFFASIGSQQASRPCARAYYQRKFG